MWISDIIKALKIIREEKQCWVAKIENNVIYLTDFSKYYIKDLLNNKDDMLYNNNREREVEKITKEQILINVKEYFTRELKNTNRAIENKWYWPMADKDKYIVQSAHGCLSIIMFAETLGVAYEDLAPLYDEYREKFKELLDNKYLLP